jgi:hypothetical protein
LVRGHGEVKTELRSFWVKFRRCEGRRFLDKSRCGIWAEVGGVGVLFCGERGVGVDEGVVGGIEGEVFGGVGEEGVVGWERGDVVDWRRAVEYVW